MELNPGGHAVDVTGAIRHLYAEKERLERVIASLEELAATMGAVRVERRGRKSMSDEERVEVSNRMKRYWASRGGLQSNPEGARPGVIASRMGEAAAHVEASGQ